MITALAVMATVAAFCAVSLLAFEILKWMDEHDSK